MKNLVPTNYKCAKCGAHGQKLWRQANCGAFSLKCAKCVAPNAHIDAKTDMLNFHFPAFPRDNGGFWEYITAPNDIRTWWAQLPIYNEQ